MTREEFYKELQLGMIERFHQLPVEEQNIMRKNTDSAYVHVAKKVIGDEVFSGLSLLRSLDE